MHFDVMVNFKHTRTLDYCIINVNYIRFYIIVIKIMSVEPRQWRSWLRVRPASGRLGVRIPAATDLSRKNRKWQLHSYTLGSRCERHGSSEMTIIYDAPCHNRCGTLKNPHCSITRSAKHRSKLKFAALNLQW